jgi:hypothetical protein
LANGGVEAASLSVVGQSAAKALEHHRINLCPTLT